MKSSFQDSRMVKHFDLTSSTKIAKDGGTIHGSPTFSRRGINLNGSSDYVIYEIPNNLMASEKLSIAIEFTPDFTFDTTTRYFIDDEDSNYRIFEASDDKIYVYFGGTLLGAPSFSTFSAYWKQNERNVFVFAHDGTTKYMYLNGNLFNSGAVGFTPTHPDTLYMGVRNNLSSLFDGEIKSVSIYNDLLTAEDAQALYDNSLFNFQNKADVWLDMKSQSSDGTNQITKDKSGNGNDFTLGDGTTTSTFPVFSNPGFDFDGSTDYMLNSNASGIYNNTYQTIAICFKPDFNLDVGAGTYLFDSSQGARYLISVEIGGNMNVFLGNTSIAVITRATYESYWNVHGINTLIVTGTTGDTDCYLNGFKILNADNTAWSVTNPSSIYIGARFSVGNYFTGEIFHFSTYGSKFAQKMSPTQIRSLTSQLMRQYSK